MAYTNPAIADFKSLFFRDFSYTLDPTTGILDQDIANAFVLTNVSISQDFFGDQATYSVGYLYYAAHFLVMNIRASTQGLQGKFAWLEQSKNAGSVSQSFAIPPRILENPELALLTTTNYGTMYLQMILSQLTGVMFSVCGSTHA